MAPTQGTSLLDTASGISWAVVCGVAVNRYVQTVDAIRNRSKGKAPDLQECLLSDTCMAQLLDSTMASDAVHFMSLQVGYHPALTLDARM